MKQTFITDENSVESIEGMTYEFPYTMHERDMTDFIVPWHWHEEVEFDYAYQGSIEIQTVQKSYTIHQGEAYFINTNVMNTKRKAAGAASAIEHAHLFHPIVLSGHYKSIFETRYLNPVLKNQSIEILIIREQDKVSKDFLRILRKLTQIQQEGSDAFRIRNLLSDAWLDLLTIIENQKQTGEMTSSKMYLQNRARSMLSYLHTHYDQKITMEDLAYEIGLSTKECSRSFKSVFQKTPQEYLTEYRLEQAKRLLRDTDSSITEISYETGFGSSAYFGKIFRQYTSQTPKEYRKKFQDAP
ncbi:MAG: AraC family transcriptional regulator [Lachnospiraceae bacterium]|nr:AraC family transcriptional regulator [Lachnospiraceae bacterium]